LSEPSSKPPRESENSLGGRARRYAQVGGMVAGQAARIAGARLRGTRLDRGAHAGELKAALGGLKGPLMKVAQMMATIPDALPSEYAAELAQLQSMAPPMGKPFVRRRMAAELGPDWQRRFEEFPLDATNAPRSGRCTRQSWPMVGRSPASCNIRGSSRRSRRTWASSG
jgi:predicted unusual protein kinase regulating ubiquinone biosynthesis (AarF/ABC1/UbiB family)